MTPLQATSEVLQSQIGADTFIAAALAVLIVSMIGAFILAPLARRSVKSLEPVKKAG